MSERIDEAMGVRDAGLDRISDGDSTRVKNNGHRKRILHTACIWWSFVALGWAAALQGPTFPDLKIIVNRDLAAASWLFTAVSFGFLLGALVTGFLYDRYNKLAVLTVGTLGVALTTAAIPWCADFYAMLAMQFLLGVFSAGIDAGGTADILYVWADKAASYMQAVHFAFSVGATLAPLVTHPFLAEAVCLQHPSSSYNSSNFSAYYMTTHTMEYSTLNVENVTEIPVVEYANCTLGYAETHVHYSYLISACITMSAFVWFVVHGIYNRDIYMYRIPIACTRKMQLNVTDEECKKSLIELREVDIAYNELSKRVDTETDAHDRELVDNSYIDNDVDREDIDTIEVDTVMLRKQDSSGDHSEEMTHVKQLTKIEIHIDAAAIERNTEASEVTSTGEDTEHDHKENNGMHSREHIAQQKIPAVEAAMDIAADIDESDIITNGKDALDTFKERESGHIRKEPPLILKIVFVSLLSLLLMLYIVLEKIFSGYLMTFSLNHLNWSKADGANITAVFWICFALGRLVGIFTVKYVSETKLLISHFCILLLSILASWPSSVYQVTFLVWVCTAVSGFGMSIMFASVFSWMSLHVMVVSGKIVSVLLVSSSVSSMVFPIVLGNLMENYSAMWFVYMLVIVGTVTCLCFAVIYVLYRTYLRG